MKPTIKISFTLIALLLCSSLGFAQPFAVKSNGNVLDFVNSNAVGGQLGHLQQGTFGSFGNVDRWIGIGNPSFGGAPLGVYGMRIQDRGAIGTISLNDPGGFTAVNQRDLEIQWGGNDANKFRLNFITDPFNPNGIVNVMTGTSRGRVGINNDNPANRLDVRVNSSNTEDYAGFFRNERNSRFGTTSEGSRIGARGSNFGDIGSTAVGVSGSAQGDNGVRIGVNGAAGSGSTTVYGVLGESKTETGTAYGVYGRANSELGVEYGVFSEGDIGLTGNIIFTSDKRLKNNIQNEESVLSRVMQLRPTTYEYKDEGQFAKMHLASGTQHGFIAQEMEQVFPELVREARFNTSDFDGLADPESYMDDMSNNEEELAYKGVDYIAMIPILTRAIQEQQEVIEQQNTEIDALKEALGKNVGAFADLETNVLFQNSPNPFDQATRIRYSLKSNFFSASLIVFNMNGQQLRSYNDLQAGEGSIEVQANDLEAGMYLYSLIVDGKEVATRRMILTR